MGHPTLRIVILLCVTAFVAGCAKNDLVETPPEAPAPPPPGPPVPPPAPPPVPPSSGLDARPSNTTCLAPSRSTNSFTLGTQRAFPNLPAFVNPVALLQAPNDSSRWFVVEQNGKVRTFANDASVSTAESFIDIEERVTSGCGDCGLLGMAFHPNFPMNPRVYLAYTDDGGFRARVAEFETPDGGLTLNPNSERQILSVDQPQLGHTGGHIAFDTDGFLYIGLGDVDTAPEISAFGQGSDGERYVVSYGSGELHRLTGSVGGSGVATLLSATGCAGENARQPSSGLIPYRPSAPYFSDNAIKTRWMGLPDGQTINVNADGDWDFPNGTVIRQDLRLDERLVETRLLMRHPDGSWAGYSYEWNGPQTEATLVVGGQQKKIAGQNWIFPSEAQCLECHTTSAGRALGLETKQLAFSITYPQTGRTADQLVTHNAIRTLSPPIANPTSEVPYPNPYGTDGTLTERARAYLHTNCSQCHRPGSPTSTNIDLRYSTPLAQTNTCEVPPTAGDLGIDGARIIAVGSSDRSVLVERMDRRGVNKMPPLSLSAAMDDDGIRLLREWIDSLTSCN